jgi:hypothetical protein
MEVTFREFVPFYRERNDLCDLFVNLDSPCSVQEESEILGDSHNEKSKRKGVLIGSIPCPVTTVNESIREEGGRSHAEKTYEYTQGEGKTTRYKQQLVVMRSLVMKIN